MVHTPLEQHCSSVLRDARAHRTQREKALLSSLLAEMPHDKRRTLKRITDGEASGWLTVLPLAAEGFDLSGTQFRDQLALRYNHTPASFPKSCDGCGERFSVQHALDCKRGGLVKQGHNDVRDSDVSLAEAAWGGVVVEPVLVPENDRATHPALQADWSVRGVTGKVTGWRSLTIGSLMPTHPVTGPQTYHGKPSPDEQRVRKSESMLWSPRSSGDRSLPWCAVPIALSTLSTQPSSVALQAVLL